MYKHPKNAEGSNKRIKTDLTELEVKEKLDKFTKTFLDKFLEKVILYHARSLGKNIEINQIKKEFKVAFVTAIFGATLTQSYKEIVAPIINSIKTISNEYLDSIPEEKAKKITRLLDEIKKDDLIKTIVKASIEIFYSYEAQFMQVTDAAGDTIAVEKLAIDAVNRVFNYIAADNPSEAFSTNLITKGIIFGKSTRILAPNPTKNRFSAPGSLLIDPTSDSDKDKIPTSVLFQQVGIRINNKLYYHTDIAHIPHYGFRRALPWEMDQNTDLANEYKSTFTEGVVLPRELETKFQFDLREYKYKLSMNELDSESDRIYNVFKENTNQPVDKAGVEKSLSQDSVLFDLRKPINNFFGRETALTQLHQTLQSTNNLVVITQVMSKLDLSSSPSVSQNQKESSPTAVVGLGGIGKTQLALRYAELHADEFNNNVIWINAETEADIRYSLQRLSEKLKINVVNHFGDLKDISDLMDEVYSLFSTQKSLFIFDNAENFRQIEKFLPKSNLGIKPSILITSRYSNWKNVASTLYLNIFTEKEALEFIKKELKITNNSQDNSIINLNTLLQGLPLALQQAIAYIQQQQTIDRDYGVKHYLKIYQEKYESLLGYDWSQYANDPYTKTVLTTWLVTLDKIRRSDSGMEAITILQIMAYLYPDEIENRLFVKLPENLDIASSIHLLKAYSMINEGSRKDISVVHRLVQKVVRLKLEKNQDEFENIAKKIQLITANHLQDPKIEFHYLHFLVHMSLHPQLANKLDVPVTLSKIISTMDVNYGETEFTHMLELAKEIFTKDDYKKFLGLALFKWMRYPKLELHISTLKRIETEFHAGFLTHNEVEEIADYAHQPPYQVSNSVRRLSPSPEDSKLQLEAAKLLAEMRLRVRKTSGCQPNRKKRSLICSDSSRVTPLEKQEAILEHIGLIAKTSDWINAGYFTKDTFSAFIKGDFKKVAINFGLLASNQLLEEVSNYLLSLGKSLTRNTNFLDLFKHDGLSLNNKSLFLGHSMEATAPFLRRGTTALFAYQLVNHPKVSTKMIVSLDSIVSVVEAAENMGVIKPGIAEHINPFASLLTTLILVANDVEEAIDHTKKIQTEEKIHLSKTEFALETLRNFFNLEASDFHSEASEEINRKSYYNRLARQALNYLNHSQFTHFAFSTGGSSEILLNGKKQNRHIEEVYIPDNLPKEAHLFCAPGEDPIIAPPMMPIGGMPYIPVKPIVSYGILKDVYSCQNAMGIEYIKNSDRKIALIATENKQNSESHTFKDISTFFIVNEGEKKYFGSEADDLFILNGEGISGTLNGGKGEDSIFLNHFRPNSSLILSWDNFLHGDREVSPTSIQLENIERVFGRFNQQDIIVITGAIDYVDGYGGQDNNNLDEIYIAKNSVDNLKIILRSHTKIRYINSPGTFNSKWIEFIIPRNETGKVSIWLPFFSDNVLRHQFLFDWSFDELTEVTRDREDPIIRFHLSYNRTVFELAFKYAQHNGPAFPVDNYIFSHNPSDLSQKPIYIIAEEYSRRALELGISLLQFAGDERIVIGRNHSEILANDPLKPTHLIGNGGGDIYIITANSTQLPIPKITIYKPDHADCLIDTVNFRSLINTVKEECFDQKIAFNLRESDNKRDLILQIKGMIHQAEKYGSYNCSHSRWLRSDIASLVFHDALANRWFNELDFLYEDKQPIPMNVVYSYDTRQWEFAASTLTVDSSKSVLVLTEEDLNQYGNVVVLKRGRFLFARNKQDLILTNLMSQDLTPGELFSIVCINYYTSYWHGKNIIFRFLHGEINLKNSKTLINNALELKRIFPHDSDLRYALLTRNQLSYERVPYSLPTQNELSHESAPLISRQLIFHKNSGKSFTPQKIGKVTIGLFGSLVTFLVGGGLYLWSRRFRQNTSPLAVIPEAVALPLLSQPVNSQNTKSIFSNLASAARTTRDKKFTSSDCFKQIQEMVFYDEAFFFKANNCYRVPTHGFSGGLCVDSMKSLTWWQEDRSINWAISSKTEGLIRNVTVTQNQLYIFHSSGTEILPINALTTNRDILPLISIWPEKAREQLVAHWRWELFEKQAFQIGGHILGSHMLLHTPLGDFFKKIGLKIDWHSREDSHLLMRWITALNHTIYSELFLTSPHYSVAASAIDTLTLSPSLQKEFVRYTGYKVASGKLLIRFIADCIQFGINLGSVLPTVLALYSDSPHLAALGWGFRLMINLYNQQDLVGFYYCMGLLILPQLPVLLETLGIPVTRYLHMFLNRLSQVFMTQSLLTAINLPTDEGREVQSKIECEQGERRAQEGFQKSTSLMRSSATFFRQVKEKNHPVEKCFEALHR